MRSEDCFCFCFLFLFFFFIFGYCYVHLYGRDGGGIVWFVKNVMVCLIMLCLTSRLYCSIDQVFTIISQIILHYEQIEAVLRGDCEQTSLANCLQLQMNKSNK